MVAAPQALAARRAGLTAGAPLQASARSDAPADQPQLEIIAEGGRGRGRGGRGAREKPPAPTRAIAHNLALLFFWRVAGVTSAPEPPSPPSPIRP